MKTLLAAVTACLTVAFLPATAMAGKKSNSVTLGVAQLTWPALHLEYERKLHRKFTVGAFAGGGQYDPLLLRLAAEEYALPLQGFNHTKFGLRANLIAVGGFKHGIFVGGTARFARLSNSAEVEGLDDDVELTVGSHLFGGHLGARFFVKPGFTVSALVGVGAHRFRNMEVTAGDAGEFESKINDTLDATTYGTINAGWSF